MYPTTITFSVLFSIKKSFKLLFTNSTPNVPVPVKVASIIVVASLVLSAILVATFSVVNTSPPGLADVISFTEKVPLILYYFLIFYFLQEFFTKAFKHNVRNTLCYFLYVTYCFVPFTNAVTLSIFEISKFLRFVVSTNTPLAHTPYCSCLSSNAKE